MYKARRLIEVVLLLLLLGAAVALNLAADGAARRPRDACAEESGLTDRAAVTRSAGVPRAARRDQCRQCCRSRCPDASSLRECLEGCRQAAEAP